MVLLSSLFGRRGAKPRSGRAAPRKNCRARLQVEPLEERTVPTVLFMPHFGAETIAGGGHDGLQHPTLNLVFSGKYWDTTQGQQDESVLFGSVVSILRGPYLSGLTQYGADGKVLIGQQWNDPTTVSSNPSGLDLNLFLDGSILGHGTYPGFEHDPIYVVISDPNSSNGDNAGWNGYGVFAYLPVGIHMVWIGTITDASNHVSKDAFTDVFSHELAETISQVTINTPPGLPASVKGDNQIADHEPDGGRYLYRLDGNLVQAYWSIRDQAFIVPDNKVQKFQVVPIWNADNTFSKTFNLNVTGDQLGANYADQVQIGFDYVDLHIPGVTIFNTVVTLNGETATFDVGAINTINVNMAGGANTLQVWSVPPSVTLNIDNYALGSNDSVVVGPGGSLAGIAGTVNVANHSGQTSLFISDSLDATRTTTITDHSVVYDSLAVINYQDGSLDPAGNKHGVTTLTLDAAVGSLIYADSVGAYTDTYLDWYPGLQGFGRFPGLLRGPAAGQIHVLPPPQR
jgi:hypothetical protein